MKLFLIATLIIFTNHLLAKDVSKCSCTKMFTLRYPKKAEENKISGQVLIEIDKDEYGIFSNPVVKKGLGFGCDEEALRIAKLQIEFHNDCLRKCSRAKCCTAGKIIQSIAFQLTE